MISLKGIEKVYNSGNSVTHALKDISLDIQPGEIFGIVGRAGSGKSTLARCMNLLERPSSGTISIDNCPIMSLGAEGLRVARQKMGVLTKQPFLLSSRTVAKNIALPLEFSNTPKADIQKNVDTVLSTLGLKNEAHFFPDDLTFSQKQKVSLARTLVLKPKVLLCDDTALHLDVKSSHSFYQMLRDLNEEQNTTIIYFTTELGALKPLCNRVAILHHGEIVEEGSMLNVFVNPTSDIAKELVKSTTRLEMPAVLRRRLRAQPNENLNPVLRLSLLGPAAQESLIAHVIQQFGLTLHIIQAHLESIHDQTLGIMIVEINGQREHILKAIEFLETKGLHIEVLGYVPRTV